MSPSILMDMDTSDDFVMPPARAPPPPSAPRTLLLSPPSLSSHQEKLTGVLATHDRAHTDLQMMDRVSLGLASLPESTYDLIMILSDADGSRHESQQLLSRNLWALLVTALKSGGHVRSQDGQLGAGEGAEKNEAILAGLTVQPGAGFVKPAAEAQDSVPLRLGRKKAGAAGGSAAGNLHTNGTAASLPVNGKRKSVEVTPAGVGFDDGTNVDMDDDSDDDLIDENTLLDEDDLKRPIRIPTECKPKAKRRRACKDCSCGLAERLAAEDRAKRDQADQALHTLKLQADDLAEVDFTVQGKVGSCGNCSLGDAFRCDGCPYIGLPPFKPGEEVRLLNDDVQL